MRAAGYLASFLLALPCVVFALGIVALDHVIRTRNLLKVLYQALQAFGSLPMSVPILLVVILGFLGAAFFPAARPVATAVVLGLNIAALVVVLRGVGLPKGVGEAVYLLPSFASIGIAVAVLRA